MLSIFFVTVKALGNTLQKMSGKKKAVEGAWPPHNTEITQMNTDSVKSVFHLACFQCFITTIWNYGAVVHDFIFSVLSGHVWMH